jgi:chromosome segregation ATPase
VIVTLESGAEHDAHRRLAQGGSIVKTKAAWMMTLWVAGLGASSAIVSCTKEEPPPTVSAAESAAQKKAAADKAAADKAAGEKAAADKAVAAKVAADKAAAEKAAGQAKAETAALPTDLVEMKAEITRTMAQLDLTMAKLDALSAATGDLDEASKSSLAAIEALETETQAIKKRGDEMRNRGAAYFEAWEKQLPAMSTPEVVAIATKRKDELSAKYAEVLSAMQESRAALDAYWADMKPIRKALDDGLTPESHKLLGPQVKSAKDKAMTLKSRIDATFAKLNQVSLIYSNH